MIYVHRLRTLGECSLSRSGVTIMFIILHVFSCLVGDAIVILCVYYIYIYIYIYLLQLWYFYLNIASRERSVFSHIVRFILYATCSGRVASKINENCIVTGWEKFQRSNKSLITLVVQYGNDILLSRHIFTRLWLVKIFCVLVKYFPILYSDSCYKYYIYRGLINKSAPLASLNYVFISWFNTNFFSLHFQTFRYKTTNNI